MGYILFATEQSSIFAVPFSRLTDLGPEAENCKEALHMCMPGIWAWLNTCLFGAAYYLIIPKRKSHKVRS